MMWRGTLVQQTIQGRNLLAQNHLIRAFVAMRHFVINNARVFMEIDSLKKHVLETDLHVLENDYYNTHNDRDFGGGY